MRALTWHRVKCRNQEWDWPGLIPSQSISGFVAPIGEFWKCFRNSEIPVYFWRKDEIQKIWPKFTLGQQVSCHEFYEILSRCSQLSLFPGPSYRETVGTHALNSVSSIRRCFKDLIMRETKVMESLLDTHNEQTHSHHEYIHSTGFPINSRTVNEYPVTLLAFWGKPYRSGMGAL